jgi:hypothetical protein
MWLDFGLINSNDNSCDPQTFIYSVFYQTTDASGCPSSPPNGVRLNAFVDDSSMTNTNSPSEFLIKRSGSDSLSSLAVINGDILAQHRLQKTESVASSGNEYQCFYTGASDKDNLDGVIYNSSTDCFGWSAPTSLFYENKQCSSSQCPTVTYTAPSINTNAGELSHCNDIDFDLTINFNAPAPSQITGVLDGSHQCGVQRKLYAYAIIEHVQGIVLPHNNTHPAAPYGQCANTGQCSEEVVSLGELGKSGDDYFTTHSTTSLQRTWSGVGDLRGKVFYTICNVDPSTSPSANDIISACGVTNFTSSTFHKNVQVGLSSDCQSCSLGEDSWPLRHGIMESNSQWCTYSYDGTVGQPEVGTLTNHWQDPSLAPPPPINIMGYDSNNYTPGAFVAFHYTADYAPKAIETRNCVISGNLVTVKETDYAVLDGSAACYNKNAIFGYAAVKIYASASATPSTPPNDAVVMAVGKLGRTPITGYTNFTWSNPTFQIGGANVKETGWYMQVPNNSKVCVWPGIHKDVHAEQPTALTYAAGWIWGDPICKNFAHAGDPPSETILSDPACLSSICGEKIYLPPEQQQMPSMQVYYPAVVCVQEGCGSNAPNQGQGGSGSGYPAVQTVTPLMPGGVYYNNFNYNFMNPNWGL